MATRRTTHDKRQRERNKQQKAAAKRARRQGEAVEGDPELSTTELDRRRSGIDRATPPGNGDAARDLRRRSAGVRRLRRAKVHADGPHCGSARGVAEPLFRTSPPAPERRAESPARFCSGSRRSSCGRQSRAATAAPVLHSSRTCAFIFCVGLPMYDTSTSGSSRRFKNHAGLVGSPPRDATTMIVSPSW